MAAQLSFEEIQARLGNVMISLWQLTKELDELRAENAALKVKIEGLNAKQAEGDKKEA